VGARRRGYVRIDTCLCRSFYRVLAFGSVLLFHIKKQFKAIRIGMRHPKSKGKIK
jgi:hypothetical protein